MAPPVPRQDYVRVGAFYVNSRLNLLQLSRYLWEQSEQFLGSEGKARVTSGRLSRVVPPPVLKATRIAKHIVQFVRARAGLRSSAGARDGELLALPVAGDLALTRRSGAVKILDMQRKRVYTLLRNEEEKAKLSDRVELTKSIAHFPFAPRIEEVALEQGYFSEEFIGGRHPINFAGCKDDYAQVYQPLLVQFLKAIPLRWVDARNHVKSLHEDIVAPDGLLARMDPRDRQKVVSFTEDIFGRLSDVDGKIPLVLSHGDYFSGNIVIEGEVHRAIDWANMGYRVPLHDLYYLFMNHCCRVLDQEALERRAYKAIALLREALQAKDRERFAELADYITTKDRFRWIFYLECVQVPLVRCSDPNDRYLSSMLERISWFRDYERALSVRDEGKRSSATDDGLDGSKAVDSRG